MKKILKSLWIIQEVSNKNRAVKLGRGYFNAVRFNPYNPLSYVAIVLILIIAILMFGFVGVWKEMDIVNPFKWN